MLKSPTGKSIQISRQTEASSPHSHKTITCITTKKTTQILSKHMQNKHTHIDIDSSLERDNKMRTILYISLLSFLFVVPHNSLLNSHNSSIPNSYNSSIPNLILSSIPNSSNSSLPNSNNSSIPNSQNSSIPNSYNSRRKLHQPLYPLAPPPPPPVQTPDQNPEKNPDQPFFPEQPNSNKPPPPPLSTSAPSAVNPLNPQQNKPTKRYAIAISVGIVTLGMLSGFAFYLYKHKAKPQSDKLVNETVPVMGQPRSPASTFLYIGTVEPPTSGSVSVVEPVVENSSPYRKLNSAKRSDRYRPSPDLQPLPPLTKPPVVAPAKENSPPPMTSSDEEESNGSAFYTPHGSSFSNDEPNSNASYKSVAHSKRTSPKSRVSTSSREMKPSASSQGQFSKSVFGFSPKRPKFAPPPPPPDMARLQLITSSREVNGTSRNFVPPLMKAHKPPMPPPPPPPPPQRPLLAPKKLVETEETRKVEQKEFGPKLTLEGSKTRVTEAADVDGEDEDGSRPKLKPLHWDKVRATSEKATVWDQLKSSSFQLNEDMMESLFGCNSAGSGKKEASNISVPLPMERENRVLDPKKSQNIAILLRALNVTRDEVSEALLDGNTESMGAELLETLVRMAPTKEEEIKLKEYKGDITKLGSAERFLKTVLDIPLAFKRVEAMLYRANFDSELKDLRKSFQTLEAASEELKNSRLFLKLLEAVLRTGNRMNVGTNRGDARAFKLDTLLKLVDVKGTDGKTTLLHFVVQEITRSEGEGSDPMYEKHQSEMNSKLKEEDFRKQGLKIVSSLSKELENVKKAANMDADVLRSYVSKLELGLEKVKGILQYEKQSSEGRFFESMKMFLKGAGDEIARIKAHERKALSVVREVTGYFHGDTAKEEAHPLRIFMVVRDFLLSLDNVCKEVGKMHDNTMVGSARSFRLPPTTSLPLHSRYNTRHESSSDDESSSP